MIILFPGNLRLVPPDRVSAHEQQMYREDPRSSAHQRLTAHLAEEQRAAQTREEKTSDLEVTVVSRDSEETPRRSRRGNKVSLRRAHIDQKRKQLGSVYTYCRLLPLRLKVYHYVNDICIASIVAALILH